MKRNHTVDYISTPYIYTVLLNFVHVVTGTRSPWGDSDTPTGKKTSTPLATTPVTSIIEISTPPTVLAKSSESNAKPS